MELEGSIMDDLSTRVRAGSSRLLKKRQSSAQASRSSLQHMGSAEDTGNLAKEQHASRRSSSVYSDALSAERSARIEEKIMFLITQVKDSDDDKPLLNRQASFQTRRYVVTPMMRLFIKFEPVLELLSEAFSWFDRMLVVHYDSYIRPLAFVLSCLGLFVLTFGMHFSTSIAFVGALIKGGSDRLPTNIRQLRYEIADANVAFREIEAQLEGDKKLELRQKKLRAIMVSIDPILVSEIIEDFWRALLFAGATAKLHHAKTISLGLTLGEHLTRPVLRYVVPVLEGETEQDLHRWYSTFFSHLCSLLGVIFAFSIPGPLGVIATSVKGAHLLVMYGTIFAEEDISEGAEDLLIAMLVLCGIAIQAGLTQNMMLPSPVTLAFFPIFFVENWLIALVRWM